MKGNILVISGPSGSGKSTLMNEVLKEIKDSYFSISTTTREMREGEKNGLNYHFVSKEEFENDIDAGYFLEWAKVHDNYYGTSLKHVLKELHEGRLIIFDIDVQGHKIAKEKFGNLITSVFITTPDQKSLKQRLINRGTDELTVIEKRLANATSEMTRMREYDYFLINEDFESTLHDLKCIAYASRKKMALVDVGEFISSWANVE